MDQREGAGKRAGGRQPSLEKGPEEKLPNPISELRPLSSKSLHCGLDNARPSAATWGHLYAQQGPSTISSPSPRHQNRTPGRCPQTDQQNCQKRQEARLALFLVQGPPGLTSVCFCRKRDVSTKGRHPDHRCPYSEKDGPHLTSCFLHSLHCHQAGSRRRARRNPLRSSLGD